MRKRRVAGLSRDLSLVRGVSGVNPRVLRLFDREDLR
jgi:hypothetical protein